MNITARGEVPSQLESQMRAAKTVTLVAISAVIIGCEAPGPQPSVSRPTPVSAATPADRSAVLPQAGGLSVAFGSTVLQVQSALGTSEPPRPSQSFNIASGKLEDQGETQLRVALSGIWVFFDREGRARTIRLEAPFAGNIGGVRIGDSRATLVARLGEPPLPPTPPANLSVETRKALEELRRTRSAYQIGGVYTAAFDFGTGETVRTIFLTPLQPAGAVRSLMAVQPRAPLARPTGAVSAPALRGDWISDQPLALGPVKMMGVDISPTEGIMYDRLIDNARALLTSFNYRVEGSVLRATVTFSSAGIKEGTQFTFPARFDGDGNLVLTYGNQTATYRPNRQR
jgi:hypothetical protein